MPKISCIIVEDEPLAVKLLSKYISDIYYLELVGTFKTSLLAYEYLQNNKVNLMFLDIHLPGLKGLNLLRTISTPPLVIVTTAYHQYAVEGFELNVTDYLLKPYSFERLTKAVTKAQKQIYPPANEVNIEHSALFITIDRRKIRVDFEDIIYVQSKREYVYIVTKNKCYTTKISTKEIDLILPRTKFKRVNRSYIVAINKIESFSKKNIIIDGKSISIGKYFNK